MLSKTQWWIIGSVGVLVFGIVTILVTKAKKTNMNTNDEESTSNDTTEEMDEYMLEYLR